MLKESDSLNFLCHGVQEEGTAIFETSGITDSTTLSRPRRPESSATLLKEPQISPPFSLLYNDRKDSIGKADCTYI
jgi:hypothetical protein